MEPAPELEVSPVSFTSYARLLRGNRNFRRLWSAQIVSELGDWFYTLAIYNLLLQLTGRAGSVALALVLQVLPQTLIGPTSGVVNDRLRRKQVMIAADVGRMLIVLCMLFIRSKEMVWLVYPLLVAETLLAAFFEPARNAIIPNIVEREDVVLANTLASSTWSVNLMVGATLGGLVAALLGRDAVFVLNALSFIVSAALIWSMRFAEPHADGARPFRARELVDFSPILAGIRYVRAQVGLRSTIFVKFGNLIIGPGWVLFTVMGQNEFAVRWRGMAPERSFSSLSSLTSKRRRRSSSNSEGLTDSGSAALACSARWSWYPIAQRGFVHPKTSRHRSSRTVGGQRHLDCFDPELVGVLRRPIHRGAPSSGFRQNEVSTEAGQLQCSKHQLAASRATVRGGHHTSPSGAPLLDPPVGVCLARPSDTTNLRPTPIVDPKKT